MGKLKIGNHIVVPSHGVGKLSSKVIRTVGEREITCLEIFFEKMDMKIFLPVDKLEKQGVRPPITTDEMESVWNILKTESRGMRVVWSKRSREYSKKLLTGNIYDIAEVVRDLFPNAENPNRSYSERVIFEDGLQRLTSEVSVVLNFSPEEAEAKILDVLSKYHEVYKDSFESEKIVEDDYEMDQIPSNM